MLYIGLFASCVLTWVYFSLFLGLENKTHTEIKQALWTKKKDRKKRPCVLPEPCSGRMSTVRPSSAGTPKHGRCTPRWCTSHGADLRPSGPWDLGRFRNERSPPPQSTNRAKTQHEWIERKHPSEKGELGIKVCGAAGRGILYPNGRSYFAVRVFFFYDGARAACLPDRANGTSAFLLLIVSQSCIYKWNGWTLTAGRGGRRGRALGETLILKPIVLFLFQITTRSPLDPKVSVDRGAHAFEIWWPGFSFALRLLDGVSAVLSSVCEHRAVEWGLAQSNPGSLCLSPSFCRGIFQLYVKTWEGMSRLCIAPAVCF